ncbi:hypothetical protein [Variovorax sp. LG9.2]|jgi:hypothetical protein|uniref:hypothetical protein n=1 Tax=Variovorax sp. LG9.2 TaxID=3048626 RepID=UPI002B230EC0|nr:hypothetical protein [Variovorax sp. LG9.2]
MSDRFECFAKMVAFSDYVRRAKGLTPSEFKTLASSVRRNDMDRAGNTAQVAGAIESVATARAVIQAIAMKRDAPAATLFERLSDWAGTSF